MRFRVCSLAFKLPNYGKYYSSRSARASGIKAQEYESSGLMGLQDFGFRM